MPKLRVILPAGAALIGTVARADLQPVALWAHTNANSARYSQWLGQSWTSEHSTGNTGGKPYWIVVRACPTRDEVTAGLLDADKALNLMTWDGSSWGSPTEACSNTGATLDRGFDVAYTRQSGTMLTAYWKDAAKTIGYRTASGSGVSGEQTRSLPSLGRVRFISLTPVPGGDQIIGLFLNDSGGLYASIFDGTSFGPVTTLDTNAKYDGGESMAMVFQSQSGAGLLVYAEKDQSSPRYRTFSGGAWSSEASAPSVGAGPAWVRLAAEDGSDRVVMLTLDVNKDINACVWSGTSWGAVQEFETDVGHADVRVMDVVCPPGGGALAAFIQNSQNAIRYRSLSGSTWSAEQVGPNLGDAVMIIEAMAGASAGEAWVMASDAGADLSMLRWNGSALTLSSTLSTHLGGDPKSQAFMACVPAAGNAARPRIVQWRQVQPE